MANGEWHQAKRSGAAWPNRRLAATLGELGPPQLRALRLRVRSLIEQPIRWLKQQLRDLDKDISEMMRSSPVWLAQEDLLRGVPGLDRSFSAPC